MLHSNLFFIISALSISSVMYSQENKMNVIQLNFDTNKYEGLTLKIQGYRPPYGDAYKYARYFEGLKKGNSWIFSYPDSLYDKSEYFQLEDIICEDTERFIKFKHISHNDTIWAINPFFSNRDTIVMDAVYLQTDTFPNNLSVDNNGNTVVRTCLIDNYVLVCEPDSGLLSSMELTQSQFFWYDVDSLQYDEEVAKFINLVKTYPDSHALIGNLQNNLRIYQSKSDVQKVFDCFSQENKNSFFGKKINEYLTNIPSFDFENSILKTWDTGQSEAIVIDSTKYNLVVFSASWCVHCHKLIPVLKSIYADLSNKLAITYISVDEIEKIDNWRSLMEKENIPWRSLLAADDLEKIIDKYNVWAGIPHAMLVYPAGYFEAIDVRNEFDKERLYSLCGK